MPERPLTIATYAAGASLAAITLVYVFGPTYFLDDEAANSSRSSRKKGVVGLVNPANDCFINSVLQVLAGLPELHAYLIREMHRRALDGADLYQDITAILEEQARKGSGKEQQIPEWKILGLQAGQVTAGLKEMMDALNERPICKKTISAQGFIRVVEQSFRTRVSRTQQDAQEFLQVIAERLADEHRAARRVRKARRRGEGRLKGGGVEGEEGPNSSAPTVFANGFGEVANDGQADPDTDEATLNGDTNTSGDEDEDDADGYEDSTPFPFEGKMESQVECSFCHFKPKPCVNPFVSLTLHVPQDSTSTTLNACLDSMLRVEHIDDFTCDKCRLEHALQLNAKQLSKTTLTQNQRVSLETDSQKLTTALKDDPEKPPKDVRLPALSTAPKRRISKHMRISHFPRILAVHLSRSVWHPYAASCKNMAKVSFPESLPLGGLLERKSYTLRGVVTHKGGHNSGHYESFRRQALSPPFSTPASMGTEGIYSRSQSPRASAAGSPALKARLEKDLEDTAALESSAESPSTPPASPQSLLTAAGKRKLQTLSVVSSSVPEEDAQATSTEQQSTIALSDSTAAPPKRSQSLSQALNRRKRKVQQDRWWRISDEKVKESKTRDVLEMQREVYLLFYEIVA